MAVDIQLQLYISLVIITVIIVVDVYVYMYEHAPIKSSFLIYSPILYVYVCVHAW